MDPGKEDEKPNPRKRNSQKNIATQSLDSQRSPDFNRKSRSFTQSSHQRLGARVDYYQNSARSIKLTQKKILIFDMYGTLFGEVERLFRNLEVDMGEYYSSYLKNPDNKIELVLDNIAANLQGIQIFNQVSQKELKTVFEFPQDQEVFHKWNCGRGRLQSNKNPWEKDIRLQVLDHVLKCVKENRIQALPIELEDQIFGMEASVEEGVHDAQSQHGLLMANSRAQDLALKTEAKLAIYNNWPPEKIKFGRVPCLNFSKEQGTTS